jgi:hypothetical protein
LKSTFKIVVSSPPPPRLGVRLAAGLVLALALGASSASAQEGVFLQEDEAPRAVFPDADRFERLEVADTPDLRARVQARLGPVQPSIWEPRWVAFRAWAGPEPVGTALVVEEVGKHRPITFVVGLRPDLRVADVAVMAYREPYGGEIRQGRFLRQYREKDADGPLRASREITNIAGATLSVEAASRAVRKAQAIAGALGEEVGG